MRPESRRGGCLSLSVSQSASGQPPVFLHRYITRCNSACHHVRRGVTCVPAVALHATQWGLRAVQPVPLLRPEWDWCPTGRPHRCEATITRLHHALPLRALALRCDRRHVPTRLILPRHACPRLLHSTPTSRHASRHASRHVPHMRPSMRHTCVWACVTLTLSRRDSLFHRPRQHDEERVVHAPSAPR